jgi:hypothetical protein
MVLERKKGWKGLCDNYSSAALCHDASKIHAEKTSIGNRLMLLKTQYREHNLCKCLYLLYFPHSLLLENNLMYYIYVYICHTFYSKVCPKCDGKFYRKLKISNFIPQK